MTSVVESREGPSPVVLSFPHTGTLVPKPIHERLNETGRLLADTDWHVHRLYDGLLRDATSVRALFHRYVIDPNRPPSNESLYPGQMTTSLCPLTDFDGKPLWREGESPGTNDCDERLAAYHRPYHDALTHELKRIKALHGVAILVDCHSVRSHAPKLFDGRLPDLNIGTYNGTTCAPAVERTVMDVCAGADGYTNVLNGRFKGGWTTRHYGQPADSIHAVQIELAQSTYMTESPPWDYREDLAAGLRPVLKLVLEKLEALALDGALTKKEM